MNQPVNPPVNGLFRYRVNFAYDGTAYWGFSKQRDFNTVQAELLEALTTVFGESKNDFGMRVAGRTDAGVHAYDQVVHFDLSIEQIKRLGRSRGMVGKLNDLLPVDIRVHSVEEAPPGFDARFSATYRRYRYRIADGLAQKNPLKQRYTHWIKHPLDVLQMQAAALELYGLHDFASFCRPKLGATTIRHLREITIQRNTQDDNVIEVEIQADAFCHNMVRAIVGGLITAGEGRATPSDISATLARKTRVGSYKVAPARGLTLIKIGYPADDQLAAQAEIARNLRTLDEN
jgi:tRNA pseudouridine38-40 synthase